MREVVRTANIILYELHTPPNERITVLPMLGSGSRGGYLARQPEARGHWNAVRMILKYFKHTRLEGVTYEQGENS